MTESGIGELIRDLRFQRRWSIDETAVALSSDLSYLKRLETGSGVLPTYELLRRLHHAGVPMLDLMLALEVITLVDLERLKENVHLMDAFTLSGDGEFDALSIQWLSPDHSHVDKERRWRRTATVPAHTPFRSSGYWPSPVAGTTRTEAMRGRKRYSTSGFHRRKREVPKSVAGVVFMNKLTDREGP